MGCGHSDLRFGYSITARPRCVYMRIRVYAYSERMVGENGGTIFIKPHKPPSKLF